MPVERQVTRPAELAGSLLELACNQACSDRAKIENLQKSLLEYRGAHQKCFPDAQI